MRRELIHELFATHDGSTTLSGPTTSPLNVKGWVLTSLLTVVHLAAFGVVMWGWLDGYRFTKPLFACLLISLAINGITRFAPPASKRVVWNRLGLAAVLLGCAIVGPLVNRADIDPRRWIWLVTGVQAARALWIAPRGAPNWSVAKLLVVLGVLSAYMYVTPRLVGGWSQMQEQLFVNMLVAAAVVVLAARRTLLIGALLLGAAAGALVIIVTVAAWDAYYHFTLGIDKIVSIVLAAGAGLLIAVVGRIERQGREAQLHKIDLDYKSSAAVRRLANTLRWRGALVVKEQPDGKRTGELDDAKAVPVLIEALSSNDLHVRFSAADVLGRIGPAAAPAIKSLWHLVGTDPQPGDRPGEALARIGPEGIAALIELFHSDNPQQRAGAAQALRLADTASEAAAGALVEALGDAEAAVRQHAAASLGELGTVNDTVISALGRVAADPALAVRYAARRSIGRLEHSLECGNATPETKV
ncbi:MAG TPA: HEAT repeat domain-containing protein [Pirellulales bacterium]|nr:HEAT repeat domain-containing protein [Pirellulales bacterium]